MNLKYNARTDKEVSLLEHAIRRFRDHYGGLSGQGEAIFSLNPTLEGCIDIEPEKNSKILKIGIDPKSTSRDVRVLEMTPDYVDILIEDIEFHIVYKPK